MACVASAIFDRPRWLALAIGAVLGCAACERVEAISQPVSFPHAAHVAAEVECMTCHAGIVDRGEARLPATEVCTDCHDGSAQAPSDAQKRAMAAIEVLNASPNPEAPWSSAMRLAPHAFFPHIVHVESAKLECQGCHVGIREQTGSLAYGRTMAMDTCVDCHRQSAAQHPAAAGAIHDCARCHR